MTERIDTLSPEQESLMRVVADEWIERAVAPREIDRAEIHRALPLLYRGLGVPEVWCCESPRAVQVFANVSNNVNVCDNVDDNVRDNVDNNVHAVCAAVSAKVYAKAYNNVYNNVYDNASDNVYYNAHDKVREDVDAPLKYARPSWVTGIAHHSLASYVDYYQRIGLSFSVDVLAYVRFRRNSGVFYAVAQSDRLLVCGPPDVCNKDAEGRLHCESGPALKWGDGYAQHYWHGTAL